MGNLTVSSPVDTFMQATTRAGMFHAIVPFGTIDTTNLVMTVAGGSTGGLHVVGSGVVGGNALGLTAGDNGGYSAVAFFDVDDGNTYGALGWGNSNSAAQYKQQIYVEACDLRPTAGTPINGLSIIQTNLRGTDPSTHYSGARFIIGSDRGDIILNAYDGSGNPTQFTFGFNGITINSGGGSHVDNFLVGLDQHTGIQYRSNIFNPTHDGNSITYCSYGDTVANFGGHVFSTGGFVTAQTVKLIIGNDFISATIPFLTPLKVQDATGSFGEIGFDDNFCVIYRDNANANTHYCFGGTTSGGAGHRFFTGGVKASQRLRLQVSDDAVTAYELFFPQQAATAPTYVKGALYFDTSLNKLRIGGASAWETVSSS